MEHEREKDRIVLAARHITNQVRLFERGAGGTPHGVPQHVVGYVHCIDLRTAPEEPRGQLTWSATQFEDSLAGTELHRVKRLTTDVCKSPKGRKQGASRSPICDSR